MDQRDGLTAALNVNRLRALVAHFKAGRLISKSCWKEQDYKSILRATVQSNN